MSYMNRMYLAASVAVVKSHSDQWKKLKSLNHAKTQLFSGGHGHDPLDFRPLSGMINSGIGGFLGAGDERGKQTEKSLREAMYFNCWVQG